MGQISSSYVRADGGEPGNGAQLVRQDTDDSQSKFTMMMGRVAGNPMSHKSMAQTIIRIGVALIEIITGVGLIQAERSHDGSTTQSATGSVRMATQRDS